MPIRGSKKRFTDKNISNAPTEGGVYQITKNGKTIYIGKGDGKGGIKDRLQAAKRGDTPGVSKGTSFQTERAKNPSKREKQLLEQYKKETGKLPRHNDKIG